MKSRTFVPALVLLLTVMVLSTHAVGAQYTPRGGTGAQDPRDQQPEDNPSGLGLAFVTYLSGNTLFKSADTEDWAALTTNLSLRMGDRLWAGDNSRIEVRFSDNATAWVNLQSELDITRLARGANGDTTQLSLVSGEGTFDVKGVGAGDFVFQVDIPNVSISATGEARFRVNTLPDGSAQIGVISGSIDLETPDGVTSVHRGQMADIRQDRRIEMDFLPPADEWDRWVQSRADTYDRPAAGAQYLPPDLGVYAHEFDRSGRWVSYPAYGWVWVPAVAPDWSPYSNGRWVWAGGDYVWVSYDPWYAPFHYGRWSWASSFGWFWIAPKVRSWWSPGYVGWAIAGDSVCWVPLGPDEPYYGYGYHGPNNVNVRLTAMINITNIYINSTVINGVVAVKKDRFLRGDVTRQKVGVRENPFRGKGGDPNAIVIGRPPLKELPPIKETKVPKPPGAPGKVVGPPKRVQQQHDVIKNRPVAPGKGTSVFEPGRKTQQIRNIVKVPDLDKVAPAQQSSKPVLQEPGQKSRNVPVLVEPARKGTGAGQVQDPRPVGKRAFKRALEPQGGSAVIPSQTGVPGESPDEGQPRQEKAKKPVMQ